MAGYLRCLQSLVALAMMQCGARRPVDTVRCGETRRARCVRHMRMIIVVISSGQRPLPKRTPRVQTRPHG
jgi:hypothetical protein